MTGAIWSATGVVAAALLALLGVWLTNRKQDKRASVDVGQQLLKTFQGELRDTRDRLDKAEERIDQMESRERLYLDYIEQLRMQVPPPPPPWPPGLVRGPR